MSSPALPGLPYPIKPTVSSRANSTALRPSDPVTSHSYCLGQLYFFLSPLWWPQGQLSYLLQLVTGECIFPSPIPACGRWENHFSQTYHLNGELSLTLWAKLVSSKMNSSSQDGIDLDCTLVFCPKGCAMQWSWPIFVNFCCWLPPKFTECHCTKLPSNFLIFFPPSK